MGTPIILRVRMYTIDDQNPELFATVSVPVYPQRVDRFMCCQHKTLGGSTESTVEWKVSALVREREPNPVILLSEVP